MRIQLKFIICGLLTAILFPPFFLLPIGFIAFPYLYYILTDDQFKKKRIAFQFFSGIIYGFITNLIILIWIKEPFYINESTSSFSFLSYLLVFYCSVYYGIAFVIIGFFKKNYSKLILIPVIFVICEILRENIGYGFPWLTHALIHSGNNLSLNLIYYIGNYGLSYFTIFIFLSPVIFLFYRKNKNNFFIINIYSIILLIIILLSFFLIITRTNDQDINAKPLNVSLVQFNLSQYDKLYKIKYKERLEKIENIIINNNSDLIVFSENDYPYLITDLNELNFLQKKIKNNQSIIIGGTKKENSKYYNTLILINNDHIKEFHKKKLVPFGEFLPFRNVLKFLEPIVGNNDFTPGYKKRIIEISKELIIIPIICYEIIFFNDLLNADNIRSNLLVNITNDSWFGDLSGPYQHFYLSRLRAAEFNKTLIRVSNNGISSVINRRGKIIDYIPLNEQKIHNAKIFYSENNNLTTYHSFIYYFLFSLIIIAIIIERKFHV